MTFSEILAQFIVLRARYMICLQNLGHSDEIAEPYVKAADEAIAALSIKVELEMKK